MKVIKFEACWCNICKVMDKELDKLKNIPVDHIDMDEDSSESIAGKYGVTQLPTTLIIDDKENELRRFTGLTKAEEIQNAWKSLNE